MSSTPYTDRIQEAHDATKKDGKFRRLRMDKEGLLAEQTVEAGDPRLASMTGATLIIDFEKNEELEVWQLREICKANPDHPLSAQKLLSVMRLAEHQVIAVRADQLAELRSGHALVSASGASLSPTEKPHFGDKIEELEKKTSEGGININTAPESAIKPRKTDHTEPLSTDPTFPVNEEKAEEHPKPTEQTRRSR